MFLLASAGPSAPAQTPRALVVRGIAGPQFAYLGEMRAPYLAGLRARGIDTIAFDIRSATVASEAKEESLVIADATRAAAAEGLRLALGLQMRCAPSGSSVAPAAFAAEDGALERMVRRIQAGPVAGASTFWTLACAPDAQPQAGSDHPLSASASDPANAMRAEAILKAIAAGEPPRPQTRAHSEAAFSRVLVVPSVDAREIAAIARSIPDADAIGLPVHIAGERLAGVVDCDASLACAQDVFAAARRDGTWVKPWIVSRLSAPSDADAPAERIARTRIPQLPSTDRVAALLGRALAALRRGPGAPDGIIVDGWAPPDRFDFVRPDRFFVSGASDRGVDRSHATPTAAVRAVAAAFGRPLPPPRPDPAAVSARGIRIRLVTGRANGRTLLSGSTIEFSIGLPVRQLHVTEDWFVSALDAAGHEVLGVPELAGHGPAVLFRPDRGAGAFRVWTVVRAGGEAAATSQTYVVCAAFPC